MFSHLHRLYTVKRRTAIVIASIFFCGVSLVTYFTPPDLNLTPFYLLNVVLISWNCGIGLGLAFTFLSLGVQLALGYLVGWPDARSVYFYVNSVNAAVAYLIGAILASQLRTIYDREQRTARFDFLTGALNRMAFYEALTAEIARRSRHEKPVSIAYIDCDDFKAVNDTLGHAAGDGVLCAVVDTARRALRRSDTVARLGGDEFAIILPDTDRRGAATATTKLHSALTARMAASGWRVSFSFGLGTFVAIPQSPDEVLAVCDALMYEAKTAGKDRIVHREFAAA